MNARCAPYRHVIDALGTKHPDPEHVALHNRGFFEQTGLDLRESESGPAPELPLVTGPDPRHSIAPRSRLQ